MTTGIDSAGAPALPFDLAQPYSLDAAAKRALLLPVLDELTDWHRARCAPYGRALERLFPPGPAADWDQVPYVPVRMFKTMALSSVEPQDVVRTLTSSGTSGQAVSRITLDRPTATRQTRALASIVTAWLGPKRLPMVIVDAKETLAGRATFSARGAATVGFSIFGRDHFHCLDEQLHLLGDELDRWLEPRRGAPVLVFGFTFLVWQSLCEASRRLGRRFDFGEDSVLIHGGGWKRLADQAVDNARFKQALREQLGIRRVHNYYGMVEQVGSIFMECEAGHLHCPDFAHVVVRDAVTLHPLPHGQAGLLQVLSALPLSYPGHSLLTEDLGTVHGEDDCPCGRHGARFAVHGRLPQAELRGCSDTRLVA